MEIPLSLAVGFGAGGKISPGLALSRVAEIAPTGTEETAGECSWVNPIRRKIIQPESGDKCSILQPLARCSDICRAGAAARVANAVD